MKSRESSNNRGGRNGVLYSAPERMALLAKIEAMGATRGLSFSAAAEACKVHPATARRWLVRRAAEQAQELKLREAVSNDEIRSNMNRIRFPETNWAGY